jgi:secondary thiamine-phosphate synthase enzyme
MIEKISVKTHQRNELCDITKQIRHIVEKQNVNAGLLHIFCPHTTAALTVNENCDPAVQTDISNTLNKLIPANKGYAHTEGNADAHVKSAITGSSQTLFIENGNICFGTWQGVYLCEFDGPRTREVWVKIIKE